MQTRPQKAGTSLEHFPPISRTWCWAGQSSAAPGPTLLCSLIGAVPLGNLCFSALLACEGEDLSLGWLRIKQKSERQSEKVVGNAWQLCNGLVLWLCWHIPPGERSLWCSLHGDWSMTEICLCSNRLLSSVTDTRPPQVWWRKERLCDRKIHEQIEREGEREREECETVTGWGQNEMKRGTEEEAAVSKASLQLPSAGVFINNSGERLADNLQLSIRFNPLKDLNVH